MKNEGKVFEEDIQKSADKCGLFFTRIKDTFVPSDLRRRVTVAKNDYDCLMFGGNHLFALELKSTKDKSISFDEKIIKKHQIEKLEEASKYENVIAGFLFNFREPDNVVYFVNIKDFLDYKYIAENEIKEHTYQSRVNKSSISEPICKEIGIEVKGYQPRSRWHYHLKMFIEGAIKKYEY